MSWLARSAWSIITDQEIENDNVYFNSCRWCCLIPIIVKFIETSFLTWKEMWEKLLWGSKINMDIKLKLDMSIQKCLFFDWMFFICSSSMGQIYTEHKDEDNFLYVAYSGENTFGF